MKKLTLSLFLIAGICSQNTMSAQAKTAKVAVNNTDKGLDLSLMDTSVRPQDDFYNYVSGTWMKTAKIPSDKPTWGSFNKLGEDTDNNSMTILNSLLKSIKQQLISSINYRNSIARCKHLSHVMALSQRSKALVRARLSHYEQTLMRYLL